MRRVESIQCSWRHTIGIPIDDSLPVSAKPVNGRHDIEPGRPEDEGREGEVAESAVPRRRSLVISRARDIRQLCQVSTGRDRRHDMRSVRPRRPRRHGGGAELSLDETSGIAPGRRSGADAAARRLVPCSSFPQPDRGGVTGRPPTSAWSHTNRPGGGASTRDGGWQAQPRGGPRRTLCSRRSRTPTRRPAGLPLNLQPALTTDANRGHSCPACRDPRWGAHEEGV